jgi:hypothetical protein
VSSIARLLRCEARHEPGLAVRFLPSPPIHRALWKAFYLPRGAWRWRSAYPVYAPLAAYASLVSLDLWKALRADRPDFLFAHGQRRAASTRSRVALARSDPARRLPRREHPEWYQGCLWKRFTLRSAHCSAVSGEGRAAPRLAGRYGVADLPALPDAGRHAALPSAPARGCCAALGARLPRAAIPSRPDDRVSA